MSKGDHQKNPNYVDTLRPPVGPKYKLPSEIGCQEHDPRKKRNPCYSFGQRVPTPDENTGAGPAKYYPEELNRYGRKHTPGYMGRRYDNVSQDNTPGPSTYKPPDLIGLHRSKSYKLRAPEFVMGNKLELKDDSSSPGPAAYQPLNLIGPDGCKVSKQKAPAYTLGGKLDTTIADNTPGPKYLPAKQNNHKILISMQGRAKDNFDNGVPGANTYHLGLYKPGRNLPKFAMGIRYPDWQQPLITRADCYYEP